jgi:cytochrome P450
VNNQTLKKGQMQMQLIQQTSLARRIKRELPASPPQPSTLQTLAARRWPYTYFEYCQRTCGDLFTLYPLDMAPMVFFADPGEARSVLTGDDAALHAGAGARTIAPLIGEQSFMLLEEDDHLRGRRIISPAFHKQMVARQRDALIDVVEAEIASWPLGTPVPLLGRIRALTLTAILRLIFGPDHELDRLHFLLTRMLGVSDSLMLQGPRLQKIVGWRRAWRRFTVERHEVDKLIDRLVSRRRRSDHLGTRGDLLDMLLAATDLAGSPLSEQQLRDNLMSMIVAGHETTTGELAWALLLLAHNPAVQNRLSEELKTGGEDYLVATVHETLRRKPVFVFTIPREVVRPVQIGDWEYTRPAQLVACTYLLHHNPDLYPEPYAFRPERFLGGAPDAKIWLPWGGGRKHCLGRHFAMLELTTVLRHVLSTRAVLKAGERVERPRWRSAILVPSQGARVVLELRQGGRRNFF